MYEAALWFGLLLWLGICAIYWRLPCASAFHPGTYYLLFHGLVFAIRPLLAFYQGFDGLYIVYQFRPAPETKLKAMLAADLGLVIFMGVVVHVGNVQPRLRPAASLRPVLAQSHRAFLWMAAICLPLGLASLQSSIGERLAGFNTMIRDGGTGFAINTKANGYFTDFQLVLGPIAVMTAWHYRFRPIACLPMILFVVARAGTGGRWPFVLGAVSFALFLLFDQRRRWFDGRILAIGAATLALFTVIGIDRGATLRSVIGGEDKADFAAVERPLESMDYGNMEFFEYLVHVVPARTGTYSYFTDNLQIFTEPVPRVLWPAKPVGPPVKFFSLFDYGYPIGMTYSLPGNGWMQLGWAGVAIWCAVFAYLYGRIHNAFMRCRQTPFQVAAYLLFLPLSINFFRDGVLLTMIKFGASSLVPVALWWALAPRLRSHPARVSPVGVPAR